MQALRLPLFASAFAAIVVVQASTASAQDRSQLAALPPVAVPALTGGPARPILAWVDFCRRHEADCRVDLHEPDSVRMSPALWKALNDVNRQVNHTVSSVTDLEHWGSVDRWDYAEDNLGDCEDFQLLKRKRLVELGVPRRVMLMTVVLDENNEGHAVLMVRTDRGDIILDNKRDAVLAWQNTGYTYIKRESQVDTSWVSLAPSSQVATTAAK